MEVSAGSGTVRPVRGVVRRRPAGAPSARKPARRSPGRSSRRSGGPSGYFQATRSLGVSFVLTLPILLLYNISLIIPSNDQMSSVDLLSRFVSSQWGLYGMLGVNTIAGVASVVLAVMLIRNGTIRGWYGLALLAESAVWAAVVGGAGHLLISQIQGVSPVLSILKPTADYSLLQIFTMSAGAGYWEELWFRLVAVGGPWWIAKKIVSSRLGGSRRGGAGSRSGGGSKAGAGLFAGSGGAIPVAVAIFFLLASAAGFSLLHYVGTTANPDLISFSFRALSGLIFGILFLTRGFCVAVCAHFMYDVFAFMFG